MRYGIKKKHMRYLLFFCLYYFISSVSYFSSNEFGIKCQSTQHSEFQAKEKKKKVVCPIRIRKNPISIYGTVHSGV